MITGLEGRSATSPPPAPTLGSVPAHWEVRAVRQLGRLIKGIGGSKEDAVDYGVPCVRYGDLYTTHHYFIRSARTCVSPTRMASYTPIRYGDVLFAASGEKLDEIGKSAVNLLQQPAVCGGDVILLRPSLAVHAPYLGYALDSPPVAHQKAMMCRGTTIKHIYPDELRQVLVPLPPIEEQAAIVRFLDHVGGRIERAIRAKRKVIALLQEQKQAIIHQAVTRGVSGAPTLRPSGVPWLGEVPAHWQVLRLKFIASTIVDCLHATPKYVPDGEFPAIRTADIEPGHVRLAQARRVSRDTFTEWTQRLVPHPGDVLYSREGERFGIAACVPNGVQLCISQRMMVFRIRACHSPHFVMWLLNAQPTFQQAFQDAMGATAPHVNISTIRNYVMAMPPFPEQQAIGEAIDERTRGIRTGMSQRLREIELLQEYRTRLTADVVTGKVDVRDVAAKLPDEPVELDTAATDDLADDTLEEELAVE